MNASHNVPLISICRSPTALVSHVHLNVSYVSVASKTNATVAAKATISSKFQHHVYRRALRPISPRLRARNAKLVNFHAWNVRKLLLVVQNVGKRMME